MEILLGFITWYILGYIFFVMYMYCKFDKVIKNDFIVALLWAFLGLCWLLAIVWHSFRDQTGL